MIAAWQDISLLRQNVEMNHVKVLLKILAKFFDDSRTEFAASVRCFSMQIYKETSREH